MSDPQQSEAPVGAVSAASRAVIGCSLLVREEMQTAELQEKLDTMLRKHEHARRWQGYAGAWRGLSSERLDCSQYPVGAQERPLKVRFDLPEHSATEFVRHLTAGSSRLVHVADLRSAHELPQQNTLERPHSALTSPLGDIGC